MISKAEAKRRVLELWGTWGSKVGKRSDKRAFYGWLQAEHPQLLDFQIGGDKWLQVELWLFGR